MSDTHVVLHDPDGRIEAKLPLDRRSHECLVKAVLAWGSDPCLRAADYHQIALQLTGAARAVAHDARAIAHRLPDRHPARALADLVLEDTERRLTTPPRGTVRCVQGRALLVRTLYERLDRLTEARPRSRPTPVRTAQGHRRLRPEPRPPRPSPLREAGPPHGNPALTAHWAKRASEALDVDETD
ncbi:restriction endonuclease [Streptomyces atratus]|uniref:restriction endonuclease n=1 Tax=Streptomyces atratus TaxID=1893 RepID=UPI00369A6AE9